MTTVLQGLIVGPPADSVRPENHAQLNVGIEPNSRIRVTLQDVSMMDAPSVEIGSQEIFTGPYIAPFPIVFQIPYNPTRLQGLPHYHTYSVSARVTTTTAAKEDRSQVSVEGDVDDDGVLTWITMTQHTVEFQPPEMTPLGSVTIDVERV
ncbi:hypothetical protein BGZ73_006686 [Actinomortierella ambigua]|nr:hypothetical protein BGZ73_006686 [Actinomortierella ambigua]